MAIYCGHVDKAASPRSGALFNREGTVDSLCRTLAEAYKRPGVARFACGFAEGVRPCGLREQHTAV